MKASGRFGLSNGGGKVFTVNDDSHHVSDPVVMASRLCACWNAMDGVATEQLGEILPITKKEAGTLGEMLSAACATLERGTIHGNGSYHHADLLACRDLVRNLIERMK